MSLVGSAVLGRLKEELILQRLQTLLVGENGLSENQLGFRKGRSTVDAIQAVVNIATNARKGDSPAQRVILCCTRHGKKKNQL